MSESTDYQLFGLTIRSEIPLPELFEADGHGPADVTIRRGDLPRTRANEELRKDGEALLLSITDVATFRISGGSEIRVAAEAGVPDRNVRLFLLGSAFGALLHQRGLLPLHANAIEVDGHAIAFVGESGAGKSTLAAWFHDRGFRLIADDVCVGSFEGDQARVLSGIPRLRLWLDALEHSGRQADGLGRSYLGDAAYEDKFDVPVERSFAGGPPLPLRAVYLLDRADEFSVRSLEGIEAADALFANTYRGAFIHAAGSQQEHWASAVRLLRSTAMFRVSRQWSLERMDEQNAVLLDHVRRQLAMDRG